MTTLPVIECCLRREAPTLPVTTIWDKPKVLNAKVSEYVTVARVHGSE